jgi:hypothetical protein
MCNGFYPVCWEIFTKCGFGPSLSLRDPLFPSFYHSLFLVRGQVFFMNIDHLLSSGVFRPQTL